MTDAPLAAAERAAWRLRLPVAREAMLCTGIATVAAALLVWLAPPGGDYAAHEYQRWLFVGHGFTLWDNFWYAGRYAFVNYSVLYYPLAALLGINLLAVLSVGVAAAAFTRLLEREWGRAARWANLCFALVWPGVILAGEFPLALGLALALLSLLALQAGRRWIAAAFIVLSLAASPVAFVLLVVVLAGIALGRRTALRGSLLPGLAIVLALAAELVVLRLFPVGKLGFPAGEAVQALLFCVYLLPLTWRLDRARGLHGFLFVYLLAVIATFVIPSGLGHDVARVRLFALPIALLVATLRRWRPWPVVVVALGLAASWNLFPLASSWVGSAADHSQNAKVWSAPVQYLRSHLRTGYRVEAVDTSYHWPALYLARAHIPLVRGWFRQDDEPVSALLYRPFTAAEYVAWLRGLGVQYVVLTDAPTDHSSGHEATVVRSGTSGLRQVFARTHVSIYAVPHPQPIIAGPGRPTVLWLHESRFAVRVPRGGTYPIAVRWSPYWHTSTGCLARSPGGMLQLRAPAAATVRIRFDVTMHGLFDAFVGNAPACRA
jgi:hypothetical protein